MFAACGYRVCALHRESFGGYTLEGLAPGEWRSPCAPQGL
jgi:16S rRNA U516 pseudouridylate synthase RsuA-like enzyme